MRSRAGRKEERETREAGEVKKLGEGDSCGEEEGGRERELRCTKISWEVTELKTSNEKRD